MPSLRPPPFLLGVLVFFFFFRRAHAFGAGNIASISKVEGENWRHGDIEDTLLKLVMARAVGGKKFDKLNVSRVYFGNWLRDYSQAIDVGTVKAVSAEAIRLLLCILGFLTFGFGSGEFEVTADRLGCYRPEDHIDNPKNYADNLDTRNYDPRLRGPVDESVELAIDPETGMKNYIANERANIMTSAYHVRRLFAQCIKLGRSYRRSHNKADFYEALRLLGTGLHCLEDFLAHSNYTELALLELGERDVFPHVGRSTRCRIEGANHSVYPLVTGTFGGVDFLHSVTGEVSDKLEQNEIQELEGTLQNSQKNDTSMLRNLLDMIPEGLFGGNSKQKLDNIQTNAATAQMQQMNVSPRDPEEFTIYIQNIFKQIMPAIEFHDELMKSISEAIEKIPVLPKIVEQLEEQLSIFVFSVIAPFVVPVIQQIQNELQTGSSEIIASSKNEQLVVFNDDNSTDPTHSMLSKDHFSNILNEIAGRTASKVVSWVVPQIMSAWDDESVDIDRLMNRIVYGVMHHPAQRELGQDGVPDGRKIMFSSVEEWWSNRSDAQKEEYRYKLSRDGVEQGENHKEGVEDSGHGCGKPLGMHKNYDGASSNSVEDKIAGAAVGAIMGGVTSGFSNLTGFSPGNGSGGLSSVMAGLGGSNSASGLLGAASSLLGGGFEGHSMTSVSSGRDVDGGYSQTYTQYGRDEEHNRYAQAEYTRTEYADGEERTQYRRYEQDEYRRDDRPSGREYEESRDVRPDEQGGYQERIERRWEDSRGSYREEESEGWRSEQPREESGGWGGRGEYDERPSEGGGFGGASDFISSMLGGRGDEREPGGDEGFLGHMAREAENAFEDDGYERRERNEYEGRGGW